MPCCDVPVMAILKEFRSMAFENGGTLGRKAHRAAAVPKYEYVTPRPPPLPQTNEEWGAGRGA